MLFSSFLINLIYISTIQVHLDVSLMQCFSKQSQSVLYQATGQSVKTKNTVEDCMQDCVDSQKLYQKECKSIMFYSQSFNCVLNNDDHTSATLYKVDISTYGYEVDYYQYTCGQKPVLPNGMILYPCSHGSIGVWRFYLVVSPLNYCCSCSHHLIEKLRTQLSWNVLWRFTCIRSLRPSLPRLIGQLNGL